MYFQRSDRVSYTAPLREPQTGNFDFDIMYSNLTVMNAVQSDRGVYMCTVKTHDGKENSVNIVINIEGKKIKWKTKCNNKIVKRGLSCEFEPRSSWGVLDITLCDKACQ